MNNNDPARKIALQFLKQELFTLSAETSRSIEPKSIGNDIRNYLGINSDAKISLIIDEINTPGEMRTISPRVYEIRIHPNVIGRTDALISVLAHEYSHVFLSEKSIKLESIIENEILTDMICIYSGFGNQMIMAKNIPAFIDKSPHEYAYGYIDRATMIIEIAKHATLANIDDSNFRSTEFKIARSQLQNDIRPLFLWKFRKWMLTKAFKGVDCLFDIKCPICNQVCRVPILPKHIMITCPTCRLKFKR